MKGRKAEVLGKGHKEMGRIRINNVRSIKSQQELKD